VAATVDLQEGLWRVAGRIDFLSQREWQNRILTAMNDENGRVDFLDSSSRIELAAYEERKTRKETKNLFGESGGGRKRCFEDYSADLLFRRQISRYGGS